MFREMDLKLLFVPPHPGISHHKYQFSIPMVWWWFKDGEQVFNIGCSCHVISTSYFNFQYYLELSGIIDLCKTTMMVTFTLGPKLRLLLPLDFNIIFQYELWIWDIVIHPLPYIALKLFMTIYHPIGFHKEILSDLPIKIFWMSFIQFKRMNSTNKWSHCK